MSMRLPQRPNRSSRASVMVKRLRVLWPLHDHADRVTLSGFSEAEGNALLLVALVDGERLVERLLQTVAAQSITASERNERLRALRLEETAASL